MELIVANTIDAYRGNMALIQDPIVREHEILDCYYIQDRALLWCGSRKVVVTSRPIEPAHLRYLSRTMAYEQLDNLAPAHPSDSLCEDILREPELRAAIAQRLRGQGTVPLIPHQSSPRVCAVAEALRQEGVAVDLPECAPADLLWVRDYLDSKSGFRQFFTSAQTRIPWVKLPEGGVAEGPAEAARLAVRLLEEGRGCLCKPNNSQSGVGFLMLHPGDLTGTSQDVQRAVQARLEANPQIASDVIVVEELLELDRTIGGGSPSLEMCVPADPKRDVEFMYLCGQILTPTGYFYGVEMYDGVVSPELARHLEEAGVAVAREMRRLGYVGIFDMDTVVTPSGDVYAVEVNTRRTGGTHAHEAALALYGPRYWERAAVICNNELPFAGPALPYDELLQLSQELLLPMAGRKEGIVLGIVTSLEDNRFGYMAFGPTIERAREIEQALLQKLEASGRRVKTV